ncbi:competence/damage-inducible protein A [Candidatus Bathyarchaeota archaeon]|nr:competence/damage-inducible protein A [Candidatus Bathyarchaeota archaeon]
MRSLKTFDIEIISIGSELCYGKVSDSNSFWLADRITRLGGTVSRITCIRDDEAQISEVLDESLKRRPRFLLVTGGLGPTKDDKTVNAISRLTKSEIVIDEATVERACQKKGVPRERLPTHFIRMARTLSGAETFANPVGISPASIMKIDETTLILMPGPPKEVQAIFQDHISPLIEGSIPRRSHSCRVVVDMVESDLSPIIEDVEREFREVYLKPLVSEYDRITGLPVEVIVFGVNDEACIQRISDVVRFLEEAVREKGYRLATVSKGESIDA